MFMDKGVNWAALSPDQKRALEELQAACRHAEAAGLDVVSLVRQQDSTQAGLCGTGIIEDGFIFVVCFARAMIHFESGLYRYWNETGDILDRRELEKA